MSPAEAPLVSGMDGPSAQLQAELQQSIRQSLSIKRPILTHLNADTSWLLQLPYPEPAERKLGRTRFNVLIDPWLRGPQSDIASWFSTQWHVVTPSVQSISQLNDVLRDFEEAEGGFVPTNVSHSGPINFVDAVAVSYEFTDHCNRQTLLELDASVPIFAPKAAARLIRSWKHFDTVQETLIVSASQSNWRRTSLSPLPSWLGIAKLGGPGEAGYYHSAVMITFALSSYENSSQHPPITPVTPAECVIYTPHGIRPSTLSHIPSTQPPIETLALLHGLHDIRLPLMQFNLGAHNGLEVQRLCGARYWVSTHDEEKKAKGLVAPLLKRKVLSFEQALDGEKERRMVGAKRRSSHSTDDGRVMGSPGGETGDAVFQNLGSGESLLLR